MSTRTFHSSANNNLEPVVLRTVEDIARTWQTSATHVYGMIRDDVFPVGVVVRLGRKIRFNPLRLAEWLDAGGFQLPGGWRREPHPETADAVGR